tara:strand:- start:324 stop:569 length:246 start_codon:yes stop_codon:yes gene_type:complete
MSANSPQFVNLSQRIDAMEEITEVLRLTKTVNKYYERSLDQIDEEEWEEITEKYPILIELQCALEDLRNQIDPTEMQQVAA